MLMKLKLEELKEFLDEKVEKYNRLDFIEHDPISIPHRFTNKEDIEISGFLAATIAWGNRTMILRNANRMMNYLDDSPHDFILHHTDSDLERISKVIHRTFNAVDFIYFIKALNTFMRCKTDWKVYSISTGHKTPSNRLFINSGTCFLNYPMTVVQ